MDSHGMCLEVLSGWRRLGRKQRSSQSCGCCRVVPTCSGGGWRPFEVMRPQARLRCFFAREDARCFDSPDGGRRARAEGGVLSVQAGAE
jgi:hypothetical protein